MPYAEFLSAKYSIHPTNLLLRRTSYIPTYEEETSMKLFSTSLLLLLLAATVPALSQEQRPEEGKPTAEQPRPEKTPDVKPEGRENQKPEERKDNAQREENKQDKNAQEDKKSQENRAQENRNDNKQMSRANGKQGGRIPEDKFRSHFGRSHTFAIHKPVIVNNQPRFQYGGYWFEIVDPWPVGWAYTDDCYIDLIGDTYYLFDPLHPGVQVALFVVL